jgi:predicted MFS family arabinose efflux permease
MPSASPAPNPEGLRPAAANAIGPPRRRLLPLLLTVIAVSQILSAFLCLTRFEEAYLRILGAKYEVLGKDLKRRVEQSLNLGKRLDRFVGLERLTETTFLTAGDLAEIHLAGPQGEILHRQSAPGAGAGSAAQALRATAASPEPLSSSPGEARLERRGDYYLLQLPLTSRFDPRAGTLGLVLPAAHLEARQAELARALGLPLAAILLLTAAAGLLAIGRGVPPPDAAAYRRRTLLTVLLLMAFSQAAFLLVAIRAFERHGRQGVEQSLAAVGRSLADQFGRILDKGVAVDKLAGAGALFAEVLEDVPEMAFLGIRDAAGGWSWFLDRQHPGANGAMPPEGGATLLALPLGGTAAQLSLGMRLDPLREQLGAMLLDGATIALVSILTVLDLLLLLVSSGRPAGRSGDPRVDPAPPQGAPATVRPALFLLVFAEALTLAILPLHARRLLGPPAGPPEEILLGLPITAFMLTMALCLPAGGALAARLGCRRAFLLGVWPCAAGMALAGCAGSLWTLVAGRCLTGAGFGLAFMAAQQFVVAHTPRDRRAEGLAMFLAAFYCGTLCGSAIGGMVAERVGFQVLFFAGAAVALLAALYAGRRLPGVPGPAPGQPPADDARPLSALRGALRLAGDRAFLTLVLLQAIPGKIGLIGLVYYAAPLMLRQQGLTPAAIGRYVMLYSLVMILAGPALARWADRRRSAPGVVFWGGVLSAAALLPLAAGARLWTVGGAILLLGLGHALGVPSQLKLAAQIPAVAALGGGAGMGVYRLVERLGNALAPLLMGLLAARLGFGAGLALLGAATLAGSLLFRLLFRDAPVPVPAGKRPAPERSWRP